MYRIGFVPILTLLIVLTILIVGGGIWYYSAHRATLSSQPLSLPSGWQTYTDQTYGYSFSYPSNWTLNTKNATSSDYCPGPSQGSEELCGVGTVEVSNNSHLIDYESGYLSGTLSAKQIPANFAVLLVEIVPVNSSREITSCNDVGIETSTSDLLLNGIEGFVCDGKFDGPSGGRQKVVYVTQGNYQYIFDYSFGSDFPLDNLSPDVIGTMDTIVQSLKFH